jgi:hypothetical protein
MAWSNSRIFRPFIADVFDNTTAVDLGTDVPKAALYGTTPTPSADVTSANSAYAVDQWIVGSEITHANWPAGGRPLASTSLNSATSLTVFYDAADTAGAGTLTLAGVFGTLVYDDTLTTPVADQGISFNYFGGTQSVTAGTFTIVWHANGIWRITIT